MFAQRPVARSKRSGLNQTRSPCGTQGISSAWIALSGSPHFSIVSSPGTFVIGLFVLRVPRREIGAHLIVPVAVHLAGRVFALSDPHLPPLVLLADALG